MVWIVVIYVLVQIKNFMNRSFFIEKRFQLQFNCVNVLFELVWKVAVLFQVKNVDVAGMLHGDELGGLRCKHMMH
jgi:hypothetical protein